MARVRCLFVLALLVLQLPGDAIARGHHGPAPRDYREALAKSILFFEGQRSGKLPPTQRVTWRQDSGLSNGAAAKVDLVGGYHDAGDNVKFGFPMAFSMTMLAWSVVEFGGLMKGELQHAREAVRWGADYLLKATAHPDTVYVQDELLWGAAWLHRATKIPTCLNYIQTNGQVLGADESDNTFGWDNKHAGARILISKSFLVQRLGAMHEYKGHADGFICSMVPGTPTDQTQYTRGGLLFKLSDSNMQYATSSAFLLLTYAKYLAFAKQTVTCGGAVVTPQRLSKIARRQVDYLLGSNPMGMSYMVGYGAKYPRRIHHRASSLPSVAAHPGKIGCSQGFIALYSGGPNPNVHVGVVVGGPNEQDQFPDQRNDHEHSEPATYINALLVGALAYLAHSYGQI